MIKKRINLKIRSIFSYFFIPEPIWQLSSAKSETIMQSAIKEDYGVKPEWILQCLEIFHNQNNTIVKNFEQMKIL